LKQELLRMEKIYKSFPGVDALKDVNISINKGEVMALTGENGAGKSTLINILSGLYQKDSGEIYFEGKPVNITSPLDAQKMDISTIHQELNLMPNLSIGENIFIAREKRKLHYLLDKKKTNNDASDLMKLVGLEINSTTLVKDLSIAQRQMVEVAKALSVNSKLIIMDEPTSSLTDREVEILMGIIRKLRDQGVSVIYISHKLSEIFDIADRITVLRDGNAIGTAEVKECSEERLIQMMVGRELKDIFAKMESKIGEFIFEVKNITSGKMVKNASFKLKKGEILGFAGLVGSGRSELMRAIYGIDKMDQGEVFLDGEKISIRHPSQAIKYGLGFVPEDRKLQGLILGMAVRENITLSSLEKVSNYCFIKPSSEKAVSVDFIEKLSIKTPTQEQKVLNLSGGNQQKVVIAKWLAISPKILILDEPTKGVDVGAKKEIHHLMSKLTQEGVSVIMVSSELPEILGMSDRIVVMHKGVIKGEFLRGEATQEKILSLALSEMTA
jgi:ribose transport system ATP-binding protein